MATINKAIKKINGLPLADMEARATLEALSLANKFEGKKWAVFGDSLSQPNTDGKDKWCDYVASYLNLNMTSYAKGGSGWYKSNKSGTWGDGNIFYSIQNASSDFDIVSIMAGVNESNLVGADSNLTSIGTVEDEIIDTPNTLCGAVKKSIELAIEKYPLAQIFVMTSIPGTGNNATINQGNLSKYSKKIIEICKLYNIPCLDLFQESGLRPWNATNSEFYYSSDYIHPNANGHKYIAQIVEEFMKNKIVIL